jgi:hypothetical protein
MAARWLAVCALAACARPYATPPIPPAPTLVAPVRDYRATTRPDLRFTIDTTPLSVVVPDPADSSPFTMATVARRVGRTVVTVRSGSGSRVRELRFYDDSGRIVRRVLDTALFPVPVTRIVRGNNGSLILPTPAGRWKIFDSAGRAIAADSIVRLGTQGEWIGVLDDGSSIIRIFDTSPVRAPPGGTVVVRSASYVRLDPQGRPRYLPIFSRDPR